MSRRVSRGDAVDHDQHCFVRSAHHAMIDVYAAAGTFADKHQLAADLANAVMVVEGVAGHPDVPAEHRRVRHELAADSLSNVDGDRTYVRVQVLTNTGALDRDKQLAVVERLTRMVAAAAGDPTLAERTWVLLTEAIPGGWGLKGHAHTNDEAGQRGPSADRRAAGPLLTRQP